MSKNDGQKKEPMSDQEFISLMVSVGIGLSALWLWKHEKQIEFWYFRNFAQIGIFILLAVGVFILLLRRFKKENPRVPKPAAIVSLSLVVIIFNFRSSF